MINFPSSPNNGDSFTANATSYVYDSTKNIWKADTNNGFGLVSLINGAYATANNVYNVANTKVDPDVDTTINGNVTFTKGLIQFVNNNSPDTTTGPKFGRATDQYITFHGGSSGNFISGISAVSNPKNLTVRVSQDGGPTAVSYSFSGSTSSITSGSYEFWHSGNDGASSGLDADLWDGNQFSSYLNQSVLTTSSPTFQNVYIDNGVADGGSIVLKSSGNQQWEIDNSGNKLRFFQPGAVYATLKTNGFGLFTDSPYANLHVIGNAIVSTNFDATNVTASHTVTSGNVISDSISVTGAGGSIQPATGIEAWYIVDNVSVSAQDSEPRGLSFSSDGTKMFLLGNTGNDITEYSLSTPWSVSSATPTGTVFSVASQETTPLGLYFKPDGTGFYIAGTTGDNIYQYSLGTAWTLSTASWVRTQTVTSYESDPNGLYFKPDGTKLYVIGTSGDDVNEFDLGTAWDISTISYVSTCSVGAYETAPQGVSFSNDGTKFWILGTTYNRIAEFTLSTPWSVSSASFNDYVNLYYAQIDETTFYTISGISDLYVNESEGKAWITDYNTDRVFEITINAATTKFSGNKLSIESQLCSIKNSLIVNRNLKVNGEVRTIGSMYSGAVYAASFVGQSGTSTFSLGTGQTTSAFNIGTALTSGIITVGGTASTGHMIIGRSTGAQPISIGDGATTSGTTKTINIGSSGTSGSYTNINLGSNIAGSLGAVTINSDVSLFGNTVSFKAFVEKANIISTGMASTNSYDISDGIVHYHTASATANSTVNLKGFSNFNSGNTISLAILNTNGATAYKVDTIQIDGASANVVKWLGGTAPAGGNASNIDVYSFSVIKTGTSTYTVLASQAQFG